MCAVIRVRYPMRNIRRTTSRVGCDVFGIREISPPLPQTIFFCSPSPPTDNFTYYYRVCSVVVLISIKPTPSPLSPTTGTQTILGIESEVPLSVYTYQRGRQTWRQRVYDIVKL